MKKTYGCSDTRSIDRLKRLEIFFESLTGNVARTLP